MADRAKREKLRTYSTHFPLVSIHSVFDLFQGQLAPGVRPDIALLSIIFGAVENMLTNTDRAVSPGPACSLTTVAQRLEPFPQAIGLAEVEDLYQRFSTLVKGSVDLTPYRLHGSKTVRTTMELVKKISNVIWAALSSSYYKDRAHIQSLYSFLTSNRLDSFGVALSVVAACQLLGLDDVHLAMTEEHVWVVFGENGSESIEVTWHGKGVEDKRGQPVVSSVTDRSWLYLNGHAVICNTYMEVAAIASSINSSITGSVDSPELTALQQQLMWLLYDRGHLVRYPVAITNIGDMEEICPTPGRPSPEVLFEESIVSAKTYYDNMHVYPYTYLAGYYYRKRRFKEALSAWAQASQVISKYNYHRDDEEVYKEFLQIANEMIPDSIRLSVELVFLDRERIGTKMKPSDGEMMDDMVPFLQDPECCALFFKFYDGICEWEEGSSTPVLHITWATHMLASLAKFDPDARSRVELLDWEEETATDGKSKMTSSSIKDDDVSDKNGNHVDGNITGKRLRRKPGRPPKRMSLEDSRILLEESGDVDVDGKVNGNTSEEKTRQNQVGSRREEKESVSVSCKNGKEKNDVGKEEDLIKELMSRVGDHGNDATDPSIVALAHACGESILNPAYLLGSGEPFAANVIDLNTNSCYAKTDVQILLTSKEKLLKSNSDDRQFHGKVKTDLLQKTLNNIRIYLKSSKMKEMKDLLTAKKLNANAIKLHLTAQSQVHVKHSRLGSDFGFGKSTRRSMKQRD